MTLIDPRDLARALFFKGLKEWNEYLAECEEDRRNGYRPHYCRHGVNQWNEYYDSICGACEDGYAYWDDAREWADAKDSAEYRVSLVEERFDVLLKLNKLGAPVSDELKEWLAEPIKTLSGWIKRYA